MRKYFVLNCLCHPVMEFRLALNQPVGQLLIDKLHQFRIRHTGGALCRLDLTDARAPIIALG